MGKPIFKKQDGVDRTVTVLIYYWDERDGPSYCGWWFGPKIGGDQVWAYNGNKASNSPPQNGWHVPWDGPEDPSLRLTFGAAAGGKGGAAPQARQQESPEDRR